MRAEGSTGNLAVQSASFNPTSLPKSQIVTSHSPGGQLLFVDPSEGFGCTLDHLPLSHARYCLMPVCPGDVWQVALQHLTHGNNQTGPTQAVVRRGQRLGLHKEGLMS